MFKEMVRKVPELISRNLSGVGTILGFIVFRHQIYLTYFDPRINISIRPCAGILLFVFAATFVGKIGLGFFRITGLLLRTTRIKNGILARRPCRILTQILGSVIEVLVGMWLSTCIMASWKRLTFLSECVHGRACNGIPLTWVMAGKDTVCTKFSSLGGIYFEVICEDFFDLTPLFTVLTFTVSVTVFISILENKTRRRYATWKSTVAVPKAQAEPNLNPIETATARPKTD